MPLKKLSVEERLSLATKSKIKTKIEKSSNYDSIDLNLLKPGQSTEGGSDSINSIDSNNNDQVSMSDELENIFSGYWDQLDEQVIYKLKAYCNELRSQITTLKQNISNNESKISSNVTPHQDVNLMNVIREKEEKIKRLLEEGNNLSKKELEQSNIIKALKTKIKQKEFDLTIYEEDIKNKLVTIEGMESEITSARAYIKKLEFKNDELENENSDVLKKYNTLFSNEYQVAKLQVENSQKYAHELKIQLKEASKNKKIVEDNYKDLQKISKDEITRLENKIEQLRIEREDSIETKNSEEYEKLLVQFQSCKKQLKEASEKIYSMEYSFDQKVEDLKLSLNNALEEEKKVQLKLKQTENQNCNNIVKLDEMKLQRDNTEKKYSDLQNKYKLIKMNFEELQADYELLKKKNQIRNNRLISESNYHLNASEPSINIYNGHLDKKLNEDLNELSFSNGKYSCVVTPSINDMGSWENHNGEKHSKSSLTIGDNDDVLNTDHIHYELDDIPDDVSYLSKRRDSCISISHDSLLLLPQTPTVDINVGNFNSQVVSRLGGEIRRLEIELTSLKLFNRKIEDERSQANDEIAALLKENESFINLKKENGIMDKKLSQLLIKHDTTLQLLGEKSERVEELENDVKDLKDVIKLQVQQLVTLQDKLKEIT